MALAALHKFWTRDLTFHFALALLLGAAARLFTAYWVYGPVAIDDFAHALLPAYRICIGEPAPIPPYRSYLLVWFLVPFFKAGMLFSSNPYFLTRFVQSALGLISLLSIAGAYLYGKSKMTGDGARILLYLTALYCAMPFASTRTFGEAQSLPFLFLGFAMAETPKNFRAFLLGITLMGISVLFRFQNGLLLVFYAGVFLFRRDLKKAWALAAVGILVGLVQCGIDLLSHRGPLETLFAYLQETVGKVQPPSETQSWFLFPLAALGLTFFPFSLPLAREWRALKPHGAACALFVLFVVAHSIPAHKEERFLIPAVGFLFILWSALWASGLKTRAVGRFYTPFAIGLNGLLLILISANNTQSGMLEAFHALQREEGPLVAFEYGSEASDNWMLSDYYRWRKDLKVARLAPRESPFREPENALTGARAFLLPAYTPDQATFASSLSARSQNGFACDPLRVEAPPLDRIIYALNPQKNQRRFPVSFLICRRQSHRPSRG
jgi:hypothetical protein